MFQAWPGRFDEGVGNRPKFHGQFTLSILRPRARLFPTVSSVAGRQTSETGFSAVDAIFPRTSILGTPGYDEMLISGGDTGSSLSDTATKRGGYGNAISFHINAAGELM